jgi:hypothetical protein
MQSPWVLPAALLGLGLVVVFGTATAADEQEIKLADCPPAVRHTFLAEAKGAVIETVTKETDEDNETVFWTDIEIGGTTYSVGVLPDGTLSEMNLAVDDEELPFDRCPEAVQASFRNEAFGAKIDMVNVDVRYGVTVYETVVDHNGKSYEIVVAADGTLVEKVLVIEDEDVELAMCPNAVQVALREHARGGQIGGITKSTGLGHETYEAEVAIKSKIYLVEVAENGRLISKSLEAAED